MATTPIDMNSPISGPDTAVTASINQDSDAERDVKLIFKLMDEAKTARSQYDNDWSQRRDYYLDRQWYGTTGSGSNYNRQDTGRGLYKSRPVMNIIRQTIQSQLPILTDNRPGFSVLPKDPSDFQFSQILSELIEAWWDNNALDHTLLEVLMDEMILDAGILKVTWDEEKEDGAGEVCVECLDPFDVFIPEDANDFQKGCPWVIHRSFKDIGELKLQFPKFADHIKADADKDNDNKGSGVDSFKMVSPIDKYSPPGMSGGSDFNPHRQQAEVWECWIDSQEIVEEELEDGEKIKKKKYPRGKLITVLPHQKLRLQGVENPYMHGKKPFVRFVDSIMPRQFYGQGEAKVLMSTQRMLNKSLANIFDYNNLMSNPLWVIEDDSGVDPSRITNQIASILITRPGKSQSIRREFPPALPSASIDLFQMILQQAQFISGVNEVTAGRRPPGITAAAAIEQLEEASQTRIRLKERNMRVSLQQLGTQVIGLMLQFYTEPRVSRITNEKGAWPRFVEFFVEQPADGAYVINRREYGIDEATGQYIPGEYEATPPTKGMMDVKVMAGTAMPWSKASRGNIAFRLFEIGAIDVAELLQALEWPRAEEIAERIKLQQQQSQQPATGGPAPGPGMPMAGGG